MKPKVAFICVHNSCRSQMAEAIGRLYGNDVFSSYSAGTEVKSEINKDAIKTAKIIEAKIKDLVEKIKNNQIKL
jgi:arsenate reductase (thioredoxin)